MWFYEERNIFGKWSPKKSLLKPGARTSEGRERKIRNLMKIPREFRDVSLSDLQTKVLPDLNNPSVTFRIEVR